MLEIMARTQLYLQRVAITSAGGFAGHCCGGGVEDGDVPAFSGGFLTVTHVKQEPCGTAQWAFWKIRSLHYTLTVNMVIFCRRWLLCLRKTRFCGVGLFLGFRREAVLVQTRDSQSPTPSQAGERRWDGRGWSALGGCLSPKVIWCKYYALCINLV